MASSIQTLGHAAPAASVSSPSSSIAAGAGERTAAWFNEALDTQGSRVLRAPAAAGGGSAQALTERFLGCLCSDAGDSTQRA